MLHSTVMAHGSFPIRKLNRQEFPSQLLELPDAPRQLTLRGKLPGSGMKLLAVVGSREYTPYGRQVCEKLITGLREYPVAIVSGLALGIDGIAHEAALAAGLPTVAIPGSGLDNRVLYPACHKDLALRILEAGGALLSEFETMWRPRKESFPQRNRIMAGYSHAVLVIEATLKSGTLITARLAADYNRDVCAVPGPVYASTSQGPHMLIKNGAALIETSADLLRVLNLSDDDSQEVLPLPVYTEQERILCELLASPQDRNTLLKTLGCTASEFNTLIASLELRGIVRERLGLVELVHSKS
jgi:DNA processing protein